MLWWNGYNLVFTLWWILLRASPEGTLCFLVRHLPETDTLHELDVSGTSRMEFSSTSSAGPLAPPHKGLPPVVKPRWSRRTDPSTGRGGSCSVYFCLTGMLSFWKKRINIRKFSKKESHWTDIVRSFCSQFCFAEWSPLLWLELIIM